jgi:TonB dependent receptor
MLDIPQRKKHVSKHRSTCKSRRHTPRYLGARTVERTAGRPNNPGSFILSGHHRIRGIETALTGYVTDAWQSTLGYAYTDARITSATSATIIPGNRVQLVPFNQFSLWNKYKIDPRWGVGLGVIYFWNSFARLLVRRQRQAAGLCSLRCRGLPENQRDVAGAAQRGGHPQQGLLGLSGWQQQHLARPAPNIQDLRTATG